jgi:glutathione peroxidase
MECKIIHPNGPFREDGIGRRRYFPAPAPELLHRRRTGTPRIHRQTAMTSIYDFQAQPMSGKPVPLKKFAGKVLLILNTASACGFTPQFAGLQALHETWGPKGLVVLGFPCNQFGAQDPGSNDEIASFCQLNYGVSFPMMAKVAVNGAEAHPLWKWLKAQAPGLLGTEGIKWNFTKFLVGKDGQVIRRYAPTDAPKDLEQDIEQALAA